MSVDSVLYFGTDIFVVEWAPHTMIVQVVLYQQKSIGRTIVNKIIIKRIITVTWMPFNVCEEKKYNILCILQNLQC